MTRPPSPAQEPATEAGRRLALAVVTNCDDLNVGVLREGILAIEAAARAEAFAEIRRGVEGLRGIGFERPEGWLNLVDRAAVLALLDPPQ